jgi:hypothetical protein
MKLPEKYKENFNVSSEGPSVEKLAGYLCSYSPCIFQLVASSELYIYLEQQLQSFGQ